MFDDDSLLQSQSAEFEQIQILQDPASGLLGVIAIHDTRLGPAFGGIRRWTYGSLGEALADALRLAAHMTLKCAVHGVPGGGGKAVVLQRPDLCREAAYRRLGEYVEAMGGRFYTGPDVGTEPADLYAVGASTRYVALPDDTGPGPMGEPTSIGVFAGIRAAARTLGFSELDGVRVLVQGLGEVGRRLCSLLAAAGANLQVADIATDRTAAARDEWGAEAVDPHDVHKNECDVYAPCALGGVVRADSIAEIRARVIAGSANNVLASLECDEALHRRGVLYAPDFVINSGGLLQGSLYFLDGKAPPRERIEAIGDLLAEIFERSAAEDLPPGVVAERKAQEALTAAPDGIHLPHR